MKIRVFFVMLCLLFITSGYSQKIEVDVQYVEKANSPESDSIYYNALRKLVWNDFLGQPNPNYAAQAMAATGFAYNTKIEEKGDVINMKIEVYSYFLKNQSWRKPAAVSAYQLEHEQKHFDIAYLGALRFISRLKATKFKSKNYKSIPNRLFVQTFQENEQIQQQYDNDTNHSIDTNAQIEWNKRIDDMLTSMDKKKP